jgi:hypothetical protein
MAQFAIGKALSTEVGGIEVDAGLKPGLHRFSLMVVNEAGLRSRVADQVVVQVVQVLQPVQPVQPLQPVRPTPRRTPRTPR